MMIKKMTFSMMLALILLGSWNGYCEEATPAEKTEASKVKPTSTKEDEKPKVVIKVNGEEINELDILGMVNTMIPGAATHGSVTEQKQDEIKRSAYDRLITKKLLAQEANKEGIVVARKDIEKEVKELRKRYRKNKTTLEDVLKKSKFTMNELKKEIEKDLAVNSIRAKKVEEFKAKAAEIWTDASLEGYYNGNLEKFQIPEAIRLRNILIKADPGGGQNAWEDAKKRAEDIMNELREGKDFAELATKYSEDIYASQGGDMGLGHQGTIISEVESIANTLNPGEAAGPIWSIYGFHIIKLEEKVPPVQMPFDQVKENLKKDRESYEIKKGMNIWINRLKMAAKIEYMNEEDRKMMGQKEEVKENDDNKDDK